MQSLRPLPCGVSDVMSGDSKVSSSETDAPRRRSVGVRIIAEGGFKDASTLAAKSTTLDALRRSNSKGVQLARTRSWSLRFRYGEWNRRIAGVMTEIFKKHFSKHRGMRSRPRNADGVTGSSISGSRISSRCRLSGAATGRLLYRKSGKARRDRFPRYVGLTGASLSISSNLDFAEVSGNPSAVRRYSVRCCRTGEAPRTRRFRRPGAAGDLRHRGHWCCIKAAGWILREVGKLAMAAAECCR